MAAASPEYAVGARYLNSRSRHPLTLRYIGPLAGTDVTWLGVEYDDPTRGKHSGEYKGERIFNTIQPGAGAFIKFPPGSRPLDHGSELIAALQERYGTLEGEDGAGGRYGQDTVLLGDSGIVVEAPGMKDVARRIGRLERLREIGFDGEWVRALGGTEHERRVLKERLKGVRTLDLSSNLMSRWSDVGEVASHLVGLQVLLLNHSRLRSVGESVQDEDRETLREAFANVTELHLGNSALTWAEAIDIASLFPSLETLFLNHNSQLVDLTVGDGQDPPTALSNLKVLSIDACRVDAWQEIARELARLPSLTTLQLSELPIFNISPRESAPAFPHLTRLTLGNTHISSWADVDRLDDWTAQRLENLRISCLGHEEGVPKQTADPLQMTGDPRADRPILIAKLPALTNLNGSHVTSAERWDSELFYIHYIERLPTEQRANWGRYNELIKKHDTGPKAPVPKASTTLKSKMINLNVIPPNGMTITVRLLPSSTVASLQKRVARQLKTPVAQVWTARPHPEAPEAIGAWEPVEEMDEGQEIGYWVRDGDTVVVVL